MSSLSRFRLVSQAENPVSWRPKTGFVMTWPKSKSSDYDTAYNPAPHHIQVYHTA